MNKIFLIMGRSASGKDAIYRQLLSDDGLGLKKIVMYTTRPRRAKEADGEQYFFRTEKEYQEFKNKGIIIEERVYHTELGPWRYFTLDDGQIDLSLSSYLMIGTLDVCHALKEYFGKKSVVPIYIDADDEVLIERAFKREKKQEHPRYDEMCRRFLADKKDYAAQNLEKEEVEHIFKNNEAIEATLSEIKAFIQTEL